MATNPDKVKLEKIINIFGAVLLSAIIITVFIVTNRTSESNLAAIEAEKTKLVTKSNVMKEVALLRAETTNLQKDISSILRSLEELKNKEKINKPR